MTDAEISTRRIDRDGHQAAEVVVRFELPEQVAEDVVDEHGELDRDGVSDRIRIAPTVDGEPV